MYDSHVFSLEYKDVKDKIADIISGDDDTDIDELAEHVQEIYNEGRMSSVQYDDLMRYIQDFQ